MQFSSLKDFPLQRSPFIIGLQVCLNDLHHFSDLGFILLYVSAVFIIKKDENLGWLSYSL